MLHGVLVVDKPAGPTSHDVVAAARRALRERRIGHTGTLDPMATGVLPLAIGRATRLVQFLTSSEKEYVARIRFGLTTDTYDVTGRELSRTDTTPAREAVVAALAELTGTYPQSPPPFSAKRVEGRRAYDLARSDRPVQPAAVTISAHRLELLSLIDGVATVEIVCSAGFYVRSLAHDLGQRLGTGGCLAELRRTRSGDFGVNQAVSLATLVDDLPAALQRVIGLERLLPGLPAVTATAEGVSRITHGRTLESAHVTGSFAASAGWVRVMGPTGALLAVARPRPAGALHPSVVLI